MLRQVHTSGRLARTRVDRHDAFFVIRINDCVSYSIDSYSFIILTTRVFVAIYVQAACSSKLVGRSKPAASGALSGTRTLVCCIHR